MTDVVPVRNALISVSNKLGLVDFALALQTAGVTLYSTGGTRKHLEDAGISVIDIAAYTEFPEMLDGRVKTLHPKVFGGILARRDKPEHMDAIDDHEIEAFDLVVVNLYPFEATIARPGVTKEEAIEQIDIGGPSLVRAAAKNSSHVAIATRPDHYSAIVEEIQAHGGTLSTLRRTLAWEAFDHCSRYDRSIADYLRGESVRGDFPPVITQSFRRKSLLRYGENPHQRAALYANELYTSANLVNARQLSGKELSYNNLLDLDSALGIVRGFAQPAASVIKHNNPCGAATGQTLSAAVEKAMAGDPLSAFGSVLGLNRTVDLATAEVLCQPGLFIEAIVAPDFEASAVGLLTTKPKWRDNVRLMKVGRLEDPMPPLVQRFISGGILVQDADRQAAVPLQWKTVTAETVEDEIWDDIYFAWEMVKHVKSNAIVLANETSLVGVGAGQMSRVDSVEIAIEKAGERSVGSVLASDAFFPFPDSIPMAADAGVIAIVQPGGSRKDQDVIDACNDHGIPMVFTGRRHFKH